MAARFIRSGYLLGFVASICLLLSGSLRAEEPTKLKFTLDWRFEGPSADQAVSHRVRTRPQGGKYRVKLGPVVQRLGVVPVALSVVSGRDAQRKNVLTASEQCSSQGLLSDRVHAARPSPFDHHDSAVQTANPTSVQKPQNLGVV